MIKKFITLFVSFFLISLVLYHGIFVGLNFGIDRTTKDRIVPLSRDILRYAGIFMILCNILRYTPTKLIIWCKNYKYPLISLTLFLLYSTILSIFYHHKEITDLLGGIKTSIFPFIILLSATLLTVKDKQLPDKIKQYLPHLLLTIIVGGFVRQGAKHLFPQWFWYLGYGPIGDRVPGVSPPLYYRTGPGGIPRLSGFFAGPNNYGYFLILFFPFILQYIKAWVKNYRIPRFVSKPPFKRRCPIGRRIILAIFFILSGLLTFSRGVLVAWFVQLPLFLIRSFPTTIQTHIRRYKRTYFVSLLLIGSIVGVLSIYKSGSTIEHIQRRTEGRQYFLQNPRMGYGLGSAGPAIHYGGLILPENTYLQILLDTGIRGGIVRALSVFFIVHSLYRNHKTKVGKLFVLGFGGLLLTGMFLHVFEDATINYIFFIIRGIMIPHNQEGSPKSKQKRIPSKNKNI